MTSSIRAANKGFSLVELMVAMAVSLIVVAATAVLFSETRQSQRALDQISNANEVGSFVLRLVGRDLANAGFYPVEKVENGVAAVGLGVYAKPAGLTDAYASGLYGCEGQKFDVVSGSCVSTAGNQADSLVVGYYTTDGFGGTGVGHRLDCEGRDVATLALNKSRQPDSVETAPSFSPERPLFVANHYHLSDPDSMVMSFEKLQVKTRGFECAGLDSAGYQNLIAGLDDFQVTYGVAGSVASDAPAGAYPIKFLPANKVNSEGALLDPATGENLSAWQRVVAVRVCVISKTYETSGVSVGKFSWIDCNGNAVPAASDSAVRKNYTQVFGVKNHLRVLY